jgi:hypothetical protein
MNRTTLLQDRRMEKFEELLKRWLEQYSWVKTKLQAADLVPRVRA